MNNDDLVEKLRDHEDRMARRGDHRAANYYGEAAEEITRLHKVNADLLKALQSINQLSSPGIRTLDDFMRDIGYICDHARAAIAKATGGK